VLENFGAVNFALALFWLTVFTGVMYVLDILVFRKQRRSRANAAVAQFDSGEALSIKASGGDSAVLDARQRLVDDNMRQPWWLEYSASFFPVIVAVFFLRSFIAEPFRIPSGSMIPTLVVGDLILVNKYVYGIRLPIINKKVLDVGQPQRGDVMVFRFPKEPDKDYIKRVVGLPGDRVEYIGKRLSINGVAIPTTSLPEFLDPERRVISAQFSEKLGNVAHRVLNDQDRPAAVGPAGMRAYGDACEMLANGIRCTVPVHSYFVMGDNRDNSLDSRFWGFVPEDNIVGKAFFIWMNFGNIKRFGSFD
jgi:signal peptidase I